MAYQMKTPGGSRNRYYNIDSAVGFGGANRRDDVMLVQFLLRLWGSDHYRPPSIEKDDIPAVRMSPFPHFYEGVGRMFQGLLPAVDGNCDGVTKTWIMMFQMSLKRLTIDGRVDPMPNQTDPPGNTMMLLNSVMWRQGYLDMPRDAPAALIQATRTVR